MTGTRVRIDEGTRAVRRDLASGLLTVVAGVCLLRIRDAEFSPASAVIGAAFEALYYYAIEREPLAPLFDRPSVRVGIWLLISAAIVAPRRRIAIEPASYVIGSGIGGIGYRLGFGVPSTSPESDSASGKV